MKSTLLTILLFFLFLANNYAQTSIGAGLVRGNDVFGISVSTLHLSGDFGISPRATYFFVSGSDVLRLDGDIQLGVFDIAKTATVYPLAGYSYFKSMGSNESTRDSATGINLGLGLRKNDGTSYFEGRVTVINNCPSCDLGYEMAYGYRIPLSR